jgi:hypothetical protein
MRLSVNTLLTIAALALIGAASNARAEPPMTSIIAEPTDRNPGAITRPATKADREWRRSRTAPRLRYAPQPKAAKRYDPPRYDGRGRRLNVPGRPDTRDAFGRTRPITPSITIAPSGPTVRTDAATRINQLPRR